ncbi:TUL4 family lipoprotein [Francisella frigiditurris]|uniref:Lipoprotein n=1 Tax=Francisella frigiditurris TaxID=1542390 RepID=A0A1J0KRR6_9GAMM|nr:TUL4 family lipoprotein [Francisella frigiditurris]APC96441.1 hypothetical protein KX01_45 [Francisella frigiditurris]
MKNRFVIFVFVLLTLGLASCSTYNSFVDSFYSDSDGVQVDSDTNTVENPDNDGETVTTDDPNATITLAYNKNLHSIDAKIITNWNGAPQGSVYLSWETPEDTSCYNTAFPIAKFKEIEDYSTDSQSVLYNNQICAGTWKAIITDKSDGSVLASSTIKILSE